MRSKTLSLFATALVACGFFAGAALAQQAAPAPAQPAPVAAPAPAPEPAPAAAPAPAAEPAPAPEPALEPEPMPMPMPMEEAIDIPVEEEQAPAPALSGHIEAAYHLNVSAPKGQSTAQELRSYDAMARNSFLLHAAHLAVNHSLNDEVSGTIEIDLGTDAALTGSAPLGGGPVDVQEAYATYAPGGFSLTAGKFATYEGIEVIEGPSNPTLTRGYLFGLAEAFTHTGVKAHYATDMFDIGVSVVNGWDRIIDDNGSKMLGFRLGVTPNDMFSAGLSGYVALGSEDGDSDDGLVSIDLTGAVAATDTVTINFQGNWGRMNAPPGGGDDPSWFGIGVQPVVLFGDIYSFGGRVEFFSDGEGTRTTTGPDAKFLNLTLTPGVTLAEGFTTRLEYRMDLSLGDDPVKDVFFNPDDGTLNSSQHTLGLGAHYVF